MKRLHSRACLLLLGSILMLGGAGHAAQPAPSVPGSQKPVPANQLPVPPPYCSDLKAGLNLSKGANGIVSLQGTVTNVGKGTCTVASVAEIFMNLAYAPQYSYNMTGVSERLVTKKIGALKPGASLPVNATFKIPDFGSWAQGGAPGNARRLFTLRIVKQDLSAYKPGEECTPANNSAAREVSYQDLKHEQRTAGS